MENFYKALVLLKNTLTQNHVCDSNFRFHKGNQEIIISKIENVVLSLITRIAENRTPEFNFVTSFGNIKTISFGKTSSRGKFSVIIYLLAKIFRLIIANKTSTKRELYYENIVHFQSQSEVDRALHDVCQILQIPIWQLRIFGTAKGLIAGPISFQIDDEVITVDTSRGTVIPQNIVDVKHVSSPAKWILLVEKDAVFHKLLQDDVLSRMGPCIIITGKGFPDVSTRMLIRRLWEELGIPILALVDADPHGIDIMCVYRFGSMAMSSHSSELACPAVRWLGIHPTDIRRLGIESQAMSTEEKNKLHCMLRRSYLAENEPIRKQIKMLLKGEVKAEMEGVSKFSTAYLTDTYIPSKVICREYL